MIPNKELCFKLLEKYDFPESKYPHVKAVEKIAEFLADGLEKKGKKINRQLVLAASLLHDIDKGMGEGAIGQHPMKGVEVLRGEGCQEVAEVIIKHDIEAFLDPVRIPKTWEEKIVALADKMAKDKVLTVDERYRLWFDEGIAEQEEVLRKTYPKLKELEGEILGILEMNAEGVKERLTKQ